MEIRKENYDEYYTSVAYFVLFLLLILQGKSTLKKRSSYDFSNTNPS